MKTFIGEARMLNGSTLIINVLGNHYPKDHAGYNPCIKMKFRTHDEAWNLYTKGLEITVPENRLRDSNDKGFKEVDFEDCIVMEMSQSEVQDAVRDYFAKYDEPKPVSGVSVSKGYSNTTVNYSSGSINRQG